MSVEPIVYPSKRLQMPGGDFMVRQFIIPIDIGGVPLWGWLDTGANVSIVPKEIATSKLGMRITDEADGGYNIASLIRVSYKTHKLDLGFYQPLGGTIQQLKVEPYYQEGVEFRLSHVPFQIPTLTWPEISTHIANSNPVFIVDEPLPWVILGMNGVIENLNISMEGTDRMRIAKSLHR